MKNNLFAIVLIGSALGLTACGSNAAKPDAAAEEKKAVVALDSATLKIDQMGETIDSLSQSAQDALDALDK